MSPMESRSSVNLGIFHRFDSDISYTDRNKIEDLAKEKFLNDLNMLLGTRRPWGSPSEKYVEINKSVINFGLPDFSGFWLSSDEQQEKIRTHILEVLEKYEPRLKNVDIKFNSENEKNEKGQIEFKISGELELSKDFEPVLINAFWSESRGQVAFEGTNN
jgi:type VI secretion system lysozyme-like protein